MAIKVSTVYLINIMVVISMKTFTWENVAQNEQKQRQAPREKL